MKKALKMVLFYFLFLILGLAAGTLFYSFYINVLNFVAGGKSNFILKTDLLSSIFFTGTCLIALICPVTVYYKIQKAGGVAHFITFIILAAVTWGGLLPLTVSLGNKYNFLSTSTAASSKLTGGYFRKSGDKIYYFTRDFQKDAFTFYDTSTVVIDTTQEGQVTLEEIQDTPDFVLYRDAAPYKDVLIKESFQESKNTEFISLRLFVLRAQRAWAKGWTFWLAFLSVGLVLCSVFGLSNLSEWKLVNTCILVVATCLILVFNTVYYMPWFEFLKIRNLDNVGMFKAMGKFMDEPVLVLINLIFAIGFSITGLIRFIHVKKSGK